MAIRRINVVTDTETSSFRAKNDNRCILVGPSLAKRVDELLFHRPINRV
jgi:hypothetical protein